MEVDLTFLRKTPPHSLEAEKTVLGSILVNSENLNIILSQIRPEDFYRNSHVKILNKIISLVDKGLPVDLLSLSEALQRDGALEEVGGASYLSSLLDGVPRSINVTYYAQIIREKSMLRRLILSSMKILESSFEHREEADAILDEAQSSIIDVAEYRVKPGFHPIGQLTAPALDMIAQLSQRQEAVTGVPSGFRDLDSLTAGFHPAEFVVIAARPSMGKTALCLNIAQHLGTKTDYAVGFFTMEMSKEQLVFRMLCSDAMVDLQKIRKGFVNDMDMQKIRLSAEGLSQARIFLDETPALSLMEMKAKSRRLKLENNLDVVFLDYIQLMRTSGRFENRNQEMSYISRSMKELAKELQVPVVGISQLSRAPEKMRREPRPVLSDLRECVTGDTPVFLVDGRRVAIRELVGQQPEVWALGSEGKVVAARSDKVWSMGIKPVLQIHLASGRRLRVTGAHRLFSTNGWIGTKHLRPGDSLRAWCDDTLFWDRVVRVEPAGEDEVFDLTVPGPASWLADGIVSHNSGALEQDADVVIFIYRPEFYNPDNVELQGLAEIIVAKQRNGPTDTIRLVYFNKYTRFADRALGYGET